MPLRTMHGDVITTSLSHAPHGSQRDFRLLALVLALAWADVEVEVELELELELDPW
jgi:hypothetical protein